MKYKVGDRVRVRSDLKIRKEYGGMIFNDVMSQHCGETVTINEVLSRGCYRIVEYGCFWTDEMFEGLVEDELTAEEAIRIQAEMCEKTSCTECRFSKRNNGKDIFCKEFIQKHPKRVVKILKQLKKDHEKKEVEVTQKIYCLVVDEERKVVHEEEIGNSDSCMDVLKNYCENHDGKFFSLMEFRYEVKQ